MRQILTGLAFGGLLVGAAALTGCATPQQTEAAAPVVSAATFNEDSVADIEARMKQFVTDGHVYGIETLLVQNGRKVSHVQHGLRNVQTGAPIDDDTIYRIYSMTKPITGVAMMQLYEQGKFKLNDPVTKFVPEFAGLRVLSESGTVPAKRAPTMQEVMSHTAGFAYGLFGQDAANTAFREQKIMRSPDLETFIDKVAEVPLIGQPGEQWRYSAAVDIQGAIIQRISGQTLGEYFSENIFEPLGMDDTAFYVEADEYERLSQVFGYNPEDGKLVPVPFPTVQYRKETIAMESGGGGLTSTMGDYAAFAQMLLNDGSLNGAQILKPSSVTLMRTHLLPDGMRMWSDGSWTEDAGKGLGFGLNLGVVIDAEAMGRDYSNGTYFWGGAAGTWFWVDPVNNLYFIGMIQRFASGGPEVDFRGISADHVYEALEE